MTKALILGALLLAGCATTAALSATHPDNADEIAIGQAVATCADYAVAGGLLGVTWEKLVEDGLVCLANAIGQNLLKASDEPIARERLYRKLIEKQDRALRAFDRTSKSGETPLSMLLLPQNPYEPAGFHVIELPPETSGSIGDIFVAHSGD